MPELPEVETVRTGLSVHLIGARIAKVELRRANLRVALPANMANALAGHVLVRIDRRAKYLLFHFDDAQVLIVHLGMSGRMILHTQQPEEYLKHDHVIFHWADGRVLVFNDARRFGLMLLTRGEELASHPLFRELGPEPLDALWGAEALYKTLHASAAPVKSVIMDQRKLVGVGNIYACESLFRAGIRPTRPADKVTKRETFALAEAIRQVLEEAIASGGSTLRDYVRSSGDAGYFQHHFSVYGRQKKPCFTCGNPIDIIRQAGRSTFFCSHCQR